MKFPPPGMNLIIQAREFKRERRWMAPYKHHQWAIIQQDKIGEDWLCLLCKKTLSSPGLGMPGTVDCAKHGTERTLKSVFWVNIKLVPEPRCPICRKRVELVTDKVAYKYKLGKNYFPFICEHCP